MSTVDLHLIHSYLAHMRHELRTPLNAIIGYGEMLLEDCTADDPEGFAPDLHHILTAGNRLLGLVNQILDPDQITADNQTSLPAYGQRIHYQLRDPLNVVLAYAEILLEKGQQVRHQAFVADLGQIDAAAQRLLYLLDEMLATTQNPLVFDELPTAAPPPIAASPPAPPRLTGYILVADDNPHNVELLTRRLHRDGHSTLTAANGRELLDLLPNHAIDLILLDIIMPEMNGYEVLAALREDERWRDLPVICLSALDDEASYLRAIELGAQDFLPKPSDPLLLQARIGASLEIKKRRDQELAFRQAVDELTAAAAACETGTFDPHTLTPLTQRGDELGRLARVFQQMAVEIHAREERLRQEVRELRIEIDRQKEATSVAQIVETEYFQQLQRQAKALRESFQQSPD
jgi:CheY-like chemotaxis protein